MCVKRIFACMAVMIPVIMMSVSCDFLPSDDEGNDDTVEEVPGSGDEGDTENPDEGNTEVPTGGYYVKSISIESSDKDYSGSTGYSFTYDEQGRLSGFTSSYDGFDPSVCSYTYGNDKLTVSVDGEILDFKLDEEGRILENEYVSVSYDADGYMTTASFGDPVYNEKFIWNDGNLVGVSSDDGMEVSFSYSKFPNRILGLDINWVMSLGFSSEMSICAFARCTGKVSSEIINPAASIAEIQPSAVSSGIPESDFGKEIAIKATGKETKEDEVTAEFEFDDMERVSSIVSETALYEVEYARIVVYHMNDKSEASCREVNGVKYYYDYDVEFVRSEQVSATPAGTVTMKYVFSYED